MNKIVLALLAVFCALPSVSAREPDLDSAEAWVGTWKNDRGQTMTISFRGLYCTISYSKGTPDTGKMRGDGDTIEFEGSTAGGYKHSEGTLVLNPDHTRITKSQNIFAQDGPTQHLEATYYRVEPRLSSSSDAEPSSRQDATDSPFAGRWKSESNPDSVLTIKVHGQSVTMTSSLGGEPPRSGTIRDGRIECRLSSHQQEIIELVNGRLIARGIFDGHEETDSYKRIR